MPIIPEKKARPDLLPVRHPQADFFVADVLDTAIKDDAASMEHPMFSLATKPDMRIREYTTRKGDTVKIAPGAYGLATIFDKDVLIYCVSLLIAAINRGEAVPRTLHIQAKDLLVATNRRTDGPAYTRLVETMERLSGTRLTTTIRTAEIEKTSGFGMIDSWDVVKQRRDGRMLSMSVTLSEWLYNAIRAKEVLTLHKDYFRIRSPLERRIYEIARKHCGDQKGWKIGARLLLEKTGSTGTVRRFRMKLKEIAKKQHLPDYALEFDEERDMALFQPKPGWLTRNHEKPPALPLGFPYTLKTDTFQSAKRFTRASGEDVYGWFEDWKVFWRENGSQTLMSPDNAFLGWCEGRAAEKKKRPNGWS